MTKWIKARHQALYWEVLGGIGLLTLSILVIRVYLIAS